MLHVDTVIDAQIAETITPACRPRSLQVLRAITRKFGFKEDAEHGVDLEEIVRDRIPPQVALLDVEPALARRVGWMLLLSTQNVVPLALLLLADGADRALLTSFCFWWR